MFGKLCILFPWLAVHGWHQQGMWVDPNVVWSHQAWQSVSKRPRLPLRPCGESNEKVSFQERCFHHLPGAEEWEGWKFSPGGDEEGGSEAGRQALGQPPGYIENGCTCKQLETCSTGILWLGGPPPRLRGKHVQGVTASGWPNTQAAGSICTRIELHRALFWCGCPSAFSRGGKEGLLADPVFYLIWKVLLMMLTPEPSPHCQTHWPQPGASPSSRKAPSSCPGKPQWNRFLHPSYQKFQRNF